MFLREDRKATSISSCGMVTTPALVQVSDGREQPVEQADIKKMFSFVIRKYLNYYPIAVKGHGDQGKL